MKISAYSLFFFLIVSASCSKHHEENIEEEVPENKHLLSMVISRIDMGGTFLADTIQYAYDDLGRIVSYTDKRSGVHAVWGYTGEQLSLAGLIEGTDTVNQLNYARYSANGDTIVLDMTHADQWGGIDSAQSTYIFSNGMLTGDWFYTVSPDLRRHFEKQEYIYNSAGNLIARTKSDLEVPLTTLLTVTAWDDKINPMHSQPKLNAMVQQLRTPVASGGVHNPTRYSDYAGEHEIIWTYDAQGYPLSFKLKDDNYIRAEYFYK